MVADLSCVHGVHHPGPSSSRTTPKPALRIGRVGMIQRTFGTLRTSIRTSRISSGCRSSAAKESQTTIATLIVFCIPRRRNRKRHGSSSTSSAVPRGGRSSPRPENSPRLHRNHGMLKPVDGTPEHLDLIRDAVANSTNENFSVNIPQARLIYRHSSTSSSAASNTAEEVLTRSVRMSKPRWLGDVVPRDGEPD